MDKSQVRRWVKEYLAPFGIAAWVLTSITFLADALSTLGLTLTCSVFSVIAAGWVVWVHAATREGAIIEAVGDGQKPRHARVPYERSHKYLAWGALGLSAIPLIIALWPVSCADEHRTVVVDADDPDLVVGVAASPGDHGDAALVADLVGKAVENIGNVRVVTGCQTDVSHRPPGDAAFAEEVEVKVWKYLHESEPVWGYRFEADALPGGVWENILVPGIDMRPVEVLVLARRTTVPLCLLSVGVRSYARGNRSRASSILSDVLSEIDELLSRDATPQNESAVGDKHLRQARAIAELWYGRCLLDESRWKEAATISVAHVKDLPPRDKGLAALAHCIAGSSHLANGNADKAKASANRSERLARVWRDASEPASSERQKRDGLLAVALHLRARAAFSGTASLSETRKAGQDIVSAATLAASGPALFRAQVLISKCSIAEHLYLQGGGDSWKDEMSGAAAEALEVLEGVKDKGTLRWSRYYLVALHNAGLSAMWHGNADAADEYLLTAYEYDRHTSDPVVTVRRAASMAQREISVSALRSAVKDISEGMQMPDCPAWFISTARVELARSQLALCVALAAEYYKLDPQDQTFWKNRKRADEIETLADEVTKAASGPVENRNALAQQVVMSTFYRALAAWLREDSDETKRRVNLEDMKRAYEAGWLDLFKSLDPSFLDLLVPGWR